MSVLNLHEIEKSYGIDQILKGFSMNINDGEKVALIGINGSGKTTIFKIITEQEDFDNGSLSIKNGVKIGYLNQLPDIDKENTLVEELEKEFKDQINLNNLMKKTERKISCLANEKNKQKDLDILMKEYSDMREEFEKKGGYRYHSKIKQVAIGLGFTHQELNKKVALFSGGEKTRIGLARLLLSEPDLLLLDEPTNHLDIAATHWLENYLKEYAGAVVIISHDRYFLDQVIDRIIELKQGIAEEYYGNYSYYLKERKERYLSRLRAYENQQKKIKKMQEAIDRLKRWGRQGDNNKFFTRARSMEKSLEKIEKLDKPVLDNKKIGLTFEIKRRSGDEVLKLEGISRSFGQKQVLQKINLQLNWQEKSAIIGGNGAGKTTLLEIIIGELKADKGTVKIGSSVRVGYYSQEFDAFNQQDDVLTAFLREVPVTISQARDLLAAFLFTEDDVFKKVAKLSGGEKSRLRLLQLMQGNFNLLLLDEPTNHLDLPSREILENALQDYPGTLLIVSHDRYFLNKVTDITYQLEDGLIKKYYGNYDYYRIKKEEEKQIADKKQVDLSEKESESKSDYFQLKKIRNQQQKRAKKIDQLEEDIIKHEEEMTGLEKKMADPENLDKFKLLGRYKNRYQDLEKNLKKLYEKWETLVEKKQG